MSIKQLILDMDIPSIINWATLRTTSKDDLDNAIVFASHSGYTYIISLLHKYGGNISAQNNAPLSSVVDTDSIETAAYLLYNGANPNNPPSLIEDSSSKEMTKLLLKYGARSTLKALSNAVEQGNLEHVELLSHGLTYTLEEFNNLLIIAISKDYRGIFEYLYELSPESVNLKVFASTVEYNRMFILNTLSSNPKMGEYVQQLYEKNNVRNFVKILKYISTKDITAYLESAVQQKNKLSIFEAMLKYLYESNIRVDINQVLIYAIQNSRVDVIKLLHKYNFNLRGMNDCAIKLAIQNKNVLIAKLLYSYADSYNAHIMIALDNLIDEVHPLDLLYIEDYIKSLK